VRRARPSAPRACWRGLARLLLAPLTARQSRDLAGASRRDRGRVAGPMCRFRMRTCGHHTRGVAWHRGAPGPARMDRLGLKGVGKGPGVCCLLGRAPLFLACPSCVSAARMGRGRAAVRGVPPPHFQAFRRRAALPLVAERRPDGVPQQVCTGLLVCAGPRIRSCTAVMF